MSSETTFLRNGLRLYSRRSMRRMARLALLFAVATFFIVVAAGAVSGYRIASLDGSLSSTETAHRAELPAEWKWTRKPISFDHMYMDSTSQRSLDWIRDGRTTSGSSQ